MTIAVWLFGYLVLFGLLTVQDRLLGPQPVPYTEFKIEVANKNVAELFARGARYNLTGAGHRGRAEGPLLQRLRGRIIGALGAPRPCDTREPKVPREHDYVKTIL